MHVPFLGSVHHRSLWARGNEGSAVHQALPVWEDWLNRQQKINDIDLKKNGRYRLSPQSCALVTRESASEHHLAGIATLTQRSDGLWSTCSVAVEAGGQGWVHTSLHHKHEEPPEEVLPPQFLGFLMDKLQANEGGNILPASAQQDHDHLSLRALTDALLEPARKLPIVLICSPKRGRESHVWRQLHWPVLAQLKGMCAVHILEPDSQNEVASVLPPRARLRPGYAFVIPPMGAGRFPVSEIYLDRGAHARLANDVRGRVRDVSLPAHIEPLVKSAYDSLMHIFRESVAQGQGSRAVPGSIREEIPASCEEQLRQDLAKAKGQEKQKSNRIRVLEGKNVALAAERDEALDEVKHLREENAWLREQAALAGVYWLHDAPFVPRDQGPRRPKRAAELLEVITDETQFPNLYFTLNDISDLTQDPKKEPYWVDRAWEALCALNDWVQYHKDHPGQGMGFLDFLKNGPTQYRKIPPKRVSSSESQTVRGSGKLSAQRMFTVPTDLDPSGRAFMYAHIRLETDYGICPRLYFLPDMKRDRPRVIIGYMGRHLRTARTN